MTCTICSYLQQNSELKTEDNIWHLHIRPRRRRLNVYDWLHGNSTR